MKDAELKLEEVEASHTLGGAGEGQVESNMDSLSETLCKRSRRNSHQGCSPRFRLQGSHLVNTYSMVHHAKASSKVLQNVEPPKRGYVGGTYNQWPHQRGDSTDSYMESPR
jgi:hypothetical protein